MELIIETEQLTKQYGTFTAVDHVNLHVPRGIIYGLLGRNGAGKTTLMKMLLQLVRPTGGSIRLFGMNAAGSRNDLYRQIGSLIETPGFYQNLTAQENLHILNRLRGQQRPGDIQKALTMVGLQNEQTKAFADYSLGMKQRLGIAAAVMHEPELLILDEPINGLDPIGIAEIRSFLTELCRTKGTTILVSSHVLNEVEQIADRIGVMHEGRLIEEVDLTELRQRNRRYTEFEVSNPDAAVRLLTGNCRYTDYVVEAHTVKIYSCELEIGEINRLFVENGLLVTRIARNEESLENYFAERIGGGGIG